MRASLLIAASGASAFLFIALGAIAQSSPNASSTAAQPDNTRTNKTDPSNRLATADSQKQNASDIDLAARIRKSVMADKSLSTYAHNVKIVSTNGQVTLNGVVRSDEEKSSVGMKAQAVAGKDQVVNDIKVSPAK
jgi:hyperosmotically inducible protein